MSADHSAARLLDRLTCLASFILDLAAGLTTARLSTYRSLNESTDIRYVHGQQQLFFLFKKYTVVISALGCNH
jgi:hypothetical protein